MHTRAWMEAPLSPCRAGLRRAALTLTLAMLGGAVGGGGPFLGAGLVGLVVLVQPRILMEIARLHGTAPPRFGIASASGRARQGPFGKRHKWLQIDHPDPITATEYLRQTHAQATKEQGTAFRAETNTKTHMFHLSVPYAGVNM